MGDCSVHVVRFVFRVGDTRSREMVVEGVIGGAKTGVLLERRAVVVIVRHATVQGAAEDFMRREKALPKGLH